MSNVLGASPDIKNIIDLSHSQGIPVLIDGCQGVVHEKIDVQDLDTDFYLFSVTNFMVQMNSIFTPKVNI